jgi:hypothetical protein
MCRRHNKFSCYWSTKLPDLPRAWRPGLQHSTSDHTQIVFSPTQTDSTRQGTEPRHWWKNTSKLKGCRLLSRADRISRSICSTYDRMECKKRACAGCGEDRWPSRAASQAADDVHHALSWPGSVPRRLEPHWQQLLVAALEGWTRETFQELAKPLLDATPGARATCQFQLPSAARRAISR